MRRICKTLAGLILVLSLFPAPSWAAQPPKAFQTAIDRIITGFNTRDGKSFGQTLDADKILDTALSGMLLNAQWEEGFRRGVKKALTTEVDTQISSQMPEGGYAKHLRFKMVGNIGHALIRIDLGDSGNGYMDLHMVSQPDGTIRIVDWYTYASGQLYTETLRQGAATLAPTPTILGKVFDIATSRKDNADTLMSLMELYNSGQYDKMARKFLTVNDDLRKSRLICVTATQAAMRTNDNELYRQVLAAIAKNFSNDDSMAFVLLDYYYLENNYDKVIEIAERMQKSFGVADAALMIIKANALLEQSKYREAVLEAQHAVKIEPEYEYSYLTLLTGQVQQKQYPEAVATADILESRFSYDMSEQSLSDKPFYSGLTASAEYRKWRSNKK